MTTAACDQNRTGQNRTGQDRTGQVRAGQGRAAECPLPGKGKAPTMLHAARDAPAPASACLRQGVSRHGCTAPVQHGPRRRALLQSARRALSRGIPETARQVPSLPPACPSAASMPVRRTADPGGTSCPDRAAPAARPPLSEPDASRFFGAHAPLRVHAPDCSARVLTGPRQRPGLPGRTIPTRPGPSGNLKHAAGGPALCLAPPPAARLYPPAPPATRRARQVPSPTGWLRRPPPSRPVPGRHPARPLAAQSGPVTGLLCPGRARDAWAVPGRPVGAAGCDPSQGTGPGSRVCPPRPKGVDA